MIKIQSMERTEFSGIIVRRCEPSAIKLYDAYDPLVKRSLVELMPASEHFTCTSAVDKP